MQEGRSERSLPRRTALCRQLRDAAREPLSRCPEVQAAAAEVADLAERVIEVVRERTPRAVLQRR